MNSIYRFVCNFATPVHQYRRVGVVGQIYVDVPDSHFRKCLENGFWIDENHELEQSLDRMKYFIPKSSIITVEKIRLAA